MMPVPDAPRTTTPAAAAAIRVLAASVLLVSSCSLFSSTESGSSTDLRVGTWGGDGAGAIVGDTALHIHFHCTFGDFPLPTPDADGRFTVSGDYLLTAFPIARGPTVPAVLSGVIRGGRMTMSAAVNDTVTQRLVALGPVTVTHGRPPLLGPCPICTVPGQRSPMARVGSPSR